jgi:hypothetical protein
VARGKILAKMNDYKMSQIFTILIQKHINGKSIESVRLSHFQPHIAPGIARPDSPWPCRSGLKAGTLLSH